jgi:hypothetical protein
MKLSTFETEPASDLSRPMNAAGMAATGASMKIVRPDAAAPMSGQKPRPSLVTLTIRFALLLVVVVVLMALAWSR